MTKVDMKIEDLLDNLLDEGISVDGLAQAVEEVGVGASHKLLARLSTKMEERRIEREAFEQSEDFSNIIGKLESTYHNELFNRQSSERREVESSSLYKISNWNRFVPVFGDDFAFVLKLAQRTVKPPFPSAFIQFIADLWGESVRATHDYFSLPSEFAHSEYSARTKPVLTEKESFKEALENSSVPDLLKEQWSAEIHQDSSVRAE